QYNLVKGSFWDPSAVTLGRDVQDWCFRTSEAERKAMLCAVSLSLALGGLVHENMVQRFINEISVSDIKILYGLQAVMENVHQEAYRIVMSVLAKNDSRLPTLLCPSAEYTASNAKIEWTSRWYRDRSSSLADRLVAFACVESIFTATIIATVLWIKRSNKLPGLCALFDLVARDKDRSTASAWSVLRWLGITPLEQNVRRIISEAVSLEIAFANDSIYSHALGLDSCQLAKHVQFKANSILAHMGLGPTYGSAYPVS
ncbi:ferritin-like superfamily, partial [Ephemerocybe angulata]